MVVDPALGSVSLAGLLILIVEDEPLIALDVGQAFADAGAKTITAHSLTAALVAVEEPALFRRDCGPRTWRRR